MSSIVSYKKSSSFQTVDYLKFFFAICIICLHTAFFAPSIIRPYVTGILYRTAVPYFFIASGFFIGLKIYKDEEKGFSIIRAWIVRLMLMLLVFEPINIILRSINYYHIDNLSIINITTKVIQSLIFYPWGALWYIQALVVAILILWLFVKKKLEIFIIPTGVLLYSFALLCNNYYSFTPYVLKGIVDDYMSVCLSARNGIFVGFIYVGIGLLMAKYKIQNTKYICIDIFFNSVMCRNIFSRRIYKGG